MAILPKHFVAEQEVPVLPVFSVSMIDLDLIGQGG